jgi:hypothetical protein
LHLLWWDLLSIYFYSTGTVVLCFGFALVGLAVYYSNLLVCLLATDQSKADMGHHPPQHNTFALN